MNIIWFLFLPGFPGYGFLNFHIKSGGEAFDGCNDWFVCYLNWVWTITSNLSITVMSMNKKSSASHQLGDKEPQNCQEQLMM